MQVTTDGRLDGVVNMERDRSLLVEAEKGIAGCRVYRWDGPWVSLGASQNPRRELLDSELAPWVMRPTGGKAVLHGHDETVGLAVPLDVLGVSSRSVKAAYRAVVGPLVEALNRCGLTCVLAEGTRYVGSGPRTADCFAHVSPNDIVDPRTGMKVCGCALRLTEKAVLVQASIPNGVPLIDPQRLFAQPAVVNPVRWDGDSLAEALGESLRRLDCLRA